MSSQIIFMLLGPMKMGWFLFLPL